MPYASKAQRRYFHAMLRRGEISPEVVEEWDNASRGLDLPERVREPMVIPARAKLRAKIVRKRELNKRELDAIVHLWLTRKRK